MMTGNSRSGLIRSSRDRPWQKGPFEIHWRECPFISPCSCLVGETMGGVVTEHTDRIISVCMLGFARSHHMKMRYRSLAEPRLELGLPSRSIFPLFPTSSYAFDFLSQGLTP